MNRSMLLHPVIFLLSLVFSVHAQAQFQDTIFKIQLLQNGRIWSDPHLNVKGDPYFFSNDFLDGSVTINHHTFESIRIRYDILNDEIQMPVKEGVLQLNKELVDSFTLYFQNSHHHFINIPSGRYEKLAGYVQVLSPGNPSLIIQYYKKIDRPGIYNVPDYFYQIQRLFVIRKNSVYLIKKKRDFFLVFADEKSKIRTFMRDNKVHLKKSQPESFIPVIRYLNGFPEIR
ncbi:MAG TPA: hypothetical protein VK179_09660 [Bacteroidales bacterium]|nr:hypothetical protein [Bacteroidales bacterium]